jgi:hypothetical protein
VRGDEADHHDHLRVGITLASGGRMVNVTTEMIGEGRRDELVAFAGFCAARISRGLRGVTAWDLYVVGGLGQSDAVVRVKVGNDTVEASASASDPAEAIWNAMCRIEQPVRDVAAAA